MIDSQISLTQGVGLNFFFFCSHLSSFFFVFVFRSSPEAVWWRATLSTAKWQLLTWSQLCPSPSHFKHSPTPLTVSQRGRQSPSMKVDEAWWGIDKRAWSVTFCACNSRSGCTRGGEKPGSCCNGRRVAKLCRLFGRGRSSPFRSRTAGEESESRLLEISLLFRNGTAAQSVKTPISNQLTSTEKYEGFMQEVHICRKTTEVMNTAFLALVVDIVVICDLSQIINLIVTNNTRRSSTSVPLYESKIWPDGSLPRPGALWILSLCFGAVAQWSMAAPQAHCECVWVF